MDDDNGWALLGAEDIAWQVVAESDLLHRHAVLVDVMERPAAAGLSMRGHDVRDFTSESDYWMNGLVSLMLPLRARKHSEPSMVRQVSLVVE